jgi:uracil-DNA glycosylase family 4
MMEPKAPLARCFECPLWAQPFVPGDGPTRTDRVIIGEAPADEEVHARRPFVGQAGRRLVKTLNANGVNRSSVYITNSVLCQPEANESPPPRDALEACRDRLVDEIRGRGPRKVLALGGTAAWALTGKSSTIKELRRQPLRSKRLGDDVEVRVTYHPSALNRHPDYPRNFGEDIGGFAGP